MKVRGTRLAVVGPANAGSPSALLLYDVRDPANPVREAVYETDYPIHNCFLTDSHAYLTANHSDRRELAIVDVSGTPREVARWGAADENPAWLDVPGFLWSCHDVYVQDEVAYVAHWDAGTWLLEVSDPASPSVISHIAPHDPADLADAPTSQGYELPGNHHYAAPNDDATVLAVNSEAWDTTPENDTAGGPGGITPYDITNPATPRELSHIPAPATSDAGLDGTWTTSHNFVFAGDRLYRRSRPSASGLDPEAVHTFPDHAGYQPDAPSLTATTTTATATRTPTTTRTTEAAEFSGSTPGFGVLAAVMGVAGAAGVARWLRDEPNS